MSSERGRAVKLSLSVDKIIVSVSNPDRGTVSDVLDAGYVEYRGEPMDIGFNARYLTDILSAIGKPKDGTVLMQMADSGAPTIFSQCYNAALQCVLMPLRVS